jgi:hypothetical protein
VTGEIEDGEAADGATVAADEAKPAHLRQGAPVQRDLRAPRVRILDRGLRRRVDDRARRGEVRQGRLRRDAVPALGFAILTGKCERDRAGGGASAGGGIEQRLPKRAGAGVRGGGDLGRAGEHGRGNQKGENGSEEEWGHGDLRKRGWCVETGYPKGSWSGARPRVEIVARRLLSVRRTWRQPIARLCCFAQRFEGQTHCERDTSVLDGVVRTEGLEEFGAFAAASRKVLIQRSLREFERRPDALAELLA